MFIITLLCIPTGQNFVSKAFEFLPRMKPCAKCHEDFKLVGGSAQGSLIPCVSVPTQLLARELIHEYMKDQIAVHGSVAREHIGISY